MFKNGEFSDKAMHRYYMECFALHSYDYLCFRLVSPEKKTVNALVRFSEQQLEKWCKWGRSWSTADTSLFYFRT